VVGNLTVGGTGKTPLVIWLVERLRAMGLRPGIVLRGYGAGETGKAMTQVVEFDSDPAQVGDEALLLRLRTGVPVRVDRDRVRAARALVAADVNVIVADDGLQHLRLARNYEIAVIDAARGFGNGYLLPAGPLREPVTRLATVGAVVINGESGAGAALAEGHAQALFSMRLCGERLYPLATPLAGSPGADSSIALASFAGKQVHAMAGIGNPQRFFDQLRGAGLRVSEHPFPDHHRYRSPDLQFDDDLPVLMTEKDAVKCRAFAADNRWYLPVTAAFVPEQGAALLAHLQGSLAC
jgi:tetraacyldisaccharide 4'-kinase